MDFRLVLIDLLNKNKSAIESGAMRSEEDTKRVLIVPFFEALGYDTRSPVEFRSEVQSPGGGRVDYAIYHDNKPVMVIECKAASNTNLMDEQGQLKKYFDASKPIVGILTNGIRYQFFVDLDKAGVMDSDPFVEVDLEGLDAEDIDDADSPIIGALSLIAKSALNAEAMQESAATFKYRRGMKRFLQEQFHGDGPHRDLVELLAKQVYTRRLGPVVRNSMTILAKEAIQELKDDLRKSALTPYEPTTTADEMEGYYIVKNILWNVVDGSPGSPAGPPDLLHHPD